MYTTVHQPYFLPWMGFFSKLIYSDYYVVLDDVHFRKRHYLDRSKIINMKGEPEWVNVPVGENFGKKIKDVTIRKENLGYMKKIVRTIEYSYAKSEFYKSDWGELKELLLISSATSKNLVRLNVSIILGILDILGIKRPQIIYSSQFNMPQNKCPTLRLIEISNLVNSNLLFGDGSSIKVHDVEKLALNSVDLFVQNYFEIHPQYQQYRRSNLGFLPGLSVVDCLLNTGRVNTLELLSAPSLTPQKYIA